LLSAWSVVDGLMSQPKSEKPCSIFVRFEKALLGGKASGLLFC